MEIPSRRETGIAQGEPLAAAMYIVQFNNILETLEYDIIVRFFILWRNYRRQ